MAITKQKKSEILGDLKERLEKARVVIFVNFHGLNNALTREIRKLLKKTDAKYTVAKKTLIKKTLEELKFKDEMPALDGETAVIFGTGDAVSPVKAIIKFGKEHPEISALGGIFEKAFIGKDVVFQLAKLPSREILLGQLLGVINSPVRGLVGALSGVQRNFVSVLSQISAKGGK